MTWTSADLMVKFQMTGLERKMTSYKSSQQNASGSRRPIFDNSDSSSNRNISADTVRRTIIEQPFTSDTVRRTLDEQPGTSRSLTHLTSSPVKGGRSDLVFSDIESVSTIPSRPVKDPKALEEGMIRLKEKILRQKQSSSAARNTTIKSSDSQVRFLAPEQYNPAGTSYNSKSAPQVVSSKVVRKRKKATAPVLEHAHGCNEAQKPVKKHPAPVHTKPATPDHRPALKPAPKPMQRKVKTGVNSTNTIITTSTWRQGAALTRKVLGNKTQETSTSTSITSDTSTPKSETKKISAPGKSVKRSKSPAKAVRKPRKIEKVPVEEPPKVKARHYDPKDVKQYMQETRKQRKGQLAADKKRQQEAEKEKEKRLKELDDFRKKALKKSHPSPVTTTPGSRDRVLTDSTTPPPHISRDKFLSDSGSKKRVSSNESSDKENTASEKSVRSIPLILPQSFPARYVPASYAFGRGYFDCLTYFLNKSFPNFNEIQFPPYLSLVPCICIILYPF